MIELTFHGHDAFVIEHDGTRLIIDPFLKNNPLATVRPEEVKVDYVLLTHAHGDHLGDGIEMARWNDATVIASNELAFYCSKLGCTTHPMHIGGGFDFPFGRVKLTIAHHGSAADLGDKTMTNLGNPCGFVISIGGKNIYHAGDTGLFLDMKLIGELDDIDAALLPIGDNFTMGIDDAVKAVEFLNPGLAIPMHYNTFDVIQAEPQEFKKKVEANGYKAHVMKIGETFTLD